ncbi:MAG: hypothetical protein PF483_10175 [Halothiobacillus sp.]|jgi:hypothetical protein|nr:hypothetical protein [Halothiobacillus sp.]
MRDTLAGVENADRLYTDFYDRTRLATWVRRYPGMVLWVKERIGRSVPGWQAYGAWSGGEGVDAGYLIDEELRVHLGDHRNAEAQTVAQAIDVIRNDLMQPGKVLRLVGLSGVGKTRLIQALFDDRIGLQGLPHSHAVYTNLSDSPSPPPIGMATNLIANRTQAVLIVDNCPADLHRRLSELCAQPDSTISVITVEYDVRDDQPEGTQVISLETSSPGLTQKLVRRRYPHISKVDAGTIANVSGGNARIAIALAEAVKRTDGISRLTNEELFQRLFWQQQGVDKALLVAAQVCSLVYSFHGEMFDGEEAELPLLAELANQTPAGLYGYVAELHRRDLVQKRGVWRAVLPHAIANRLAARALEDIPYTLIHQQLVIGGNKRFACSFSRRLSFLHDQPLVVEIVGKWLSQDGLLGDVFHLDTIGQAMFENVAPVHPVNRPGFRGGYLV